jgi:hypothetical protein
MAGPKVIVVFQKMVQNMANLEVMTPYLSKLGQEHTKYGLRPNYFNFFEHVLIKTFKEILHEEFNSEIESGWRVIFGFIKETMVADNFDEQCICELCKRAQPIFISPQGENPIMRMQEKFLPPFLVSLKTDSIKNRDYFRFLKINSKLILACKCPERYVH